MANLFSSVSGAVWKTILFFGALGSGFAGLLFFADPIGKLVNPNLFPWLVPGSPEEAALTAASINEVRIEASIAGSFVAVVLLLTVIFYFFMSHRVGSATKLADDRLQNEIATSGDRLRNELQKAEDRQREEIRKAKETSDQEIINFIETIYPNDANSPRACVAACDTTLSIDANGDTRQTTLTTLECITDTVHFWSYWVEFTQDTFEDEFEERFDFSVVDGDSGIAMSFLRLHKGPRRIDFVIFFPEMRVGDKKRIKITTTIPEYFEELRDRKTTDYSWDFRYHNSNAVPIDYRFEFSQDWGSVAAKSIEKQSPTGELEGKLEGAKSVWTYSDPTEADLRTTRKIKFSTN